MIVNVVKLYNYIDNAVLTAKCLDIQRRFLYNKDVLHIVHGLHREQGSPLHIP